MSLITFILFLIFICCFSHNISINKTIIDEMINEQMKIAKLDTFGLIIIDSNSTIYKQIYGGRQGIDTNTPFVIGSVTKSFTALAILMLNISLDDTLDKYDLGDYLDEQLLKEITVGELLNHTSGLDSFSNKKIIEKGEFSYSNYGYGLLGKIIEKKSGKSYEEYIKKNIFEPFKMVNSRTSYRSDVIDSYNNFFGFPTKYTGLESEYKDAKGFYIPAGYISTTIEDIGNYLHFYLSDDFKNKYSKMIEGGVKFDYNMYYGMGMMIRKKRDQTIYYHNGGTYSFLTQLYVYPDLDLAYFIFANTVDMLCLDPTIQLRDNLENLIIYDIYNNVDGSLFFYFHFTIDCLIIIAISLPLSYLIITIIRKIKKKKPSWFVGAKGIIIFTADVLVLMIIPIIMIIVFFGIQSNLKLIIIHVTDFFFMTLTAILALMVNFLIKLIYFFLYKKFLEGREDEIDDKVEMKMQIIDTDNSGE